jgi:hypothetical protein
MAHPWGLDDEQFAAIRALQAGKPAAPRADPVWRELIAMRLVQLDLDVQPPAIRLTLLGRRYPSPS